MLYLSLLQYLATFSWNRTESQIRSNIFRHMGQGMLQSHSTGNFANVVKVTDRKIGRLPWIIWWPSLITKAIKSWEPPPAGSRRALAEREVRKVPGGTRTWHAFTGPSGNRNLYFIDAGSWILPTPWMCWKAESSHSFSVRAQSTNTLSSAFWKIRQRQSNQPRLLTCTAVT